MASGIADGADFGRFGYVASPPIPGWDLSPLGLRPKFAGADQVLFSEPVGRLAVRSIRAHEANYAWIGGGMGPTRLRVNLFAPGPEVMFERGFALASSAREAPLLSWSEGSVGDGVETPAVRWLAVSYQTSQPPVLLTFLGRPTAMKVTGRPGDWRLEVVGEPYRGWVRFGLPLGVRALTTGDAAALGQMVASIRRHEPFWTGDSPVLRSVRARNDGDAVIGTWTFSGPNPVVPYAAFLARRGGYDVQLQTPVLEISAPTDEGPVAYSPSNTIQLRFPVLQLPRGRSLTAGNKPVPFAPPDPKRSFSIFNAGLSLMMASRPIALPGQLQDALAAYLADAPFSEEPNTKARLPLAPDGQGAGEAAFFTVLQQASLAAEGFNTRPNALFTSLLWARDSLNWSLPMMQEPRIRRRTAAVVAIAGALSADPETRLQGAIFHAGLAAERGLASWLGRDPMPKFTEPVDDLRHRLYKGPRLPRREPVLPMLVNPVRVLIGPPLLANNTATGYRLRWQALRAGWQRISLVSPQDLSIKPLRNARVNPLWMPEPNRYEIQVGVGKPGLVELEVTTAGAPIKLPPTPQIVYNEVVR